jgi:HTH-type transcriptional regulator/antitoxin HigA
MMDQHELELRKEFLSPPGDTIQEAIDELKITQRELANRMGRSIPKLNDLIKGKEPLTSNTAVLLERVLGIKKTFWLNREQRYREEISRIEEAEKLLQYSDWFKKFPYRMIQKLGYTDNIRNTKKNQSKNIENLLKFFGIGTPEQFEEIYMKEKPAFFRISLSKTPNPYGIATWLRIGELEFRKLDLPSYNKNKFKNTLINLKSTVRVHPKEFAKILRDECAECGVALIFTPTFPNAQISGAVRWINDNPLIQLSDFRKTNDMFWFAFYHEAAHVLLHGRKKDIFLDELKGSEIEQDLEKEREADEFAAEMLFPNHAYEELKKLDKIENDTLMEYCQKYNTHPAIIVGRLQHDKVLEYSHGNNYKVPINLT